MSERLLHALAYAKLGWRVLPIHHINAQGRCTCLRDDCSAPGKHPRIADWPKHATTDEKAVRGMWARWPDANIGMAMGGGFVDIETEVDCADSLEQLERTLGPLPDTVSWTSGGGGLHRLFRTALPIRNLTNVGQEILGTTKTGIDVRGEGGQAVMPPSTHASGGAYRWTNLTPDAIDVADLPEAWAAYLVEASKPATVAPPTDRPAMTAEDIQAVELRAVAYLDAMPPAVSGKGGHDQTYAAATAMVHGFGLPPDRALALLLERYNPRCHPPRSEKELRHQVEDAATKAHAHPFGWLRDPEPDPCQGVDISALLPAETTKAQSVERSGQDLALNPLAAYQPAAQLMKDYTSMCKPVIHGLLREGEIMNVIAAPKTGKSWLVLDLALSVVTGRPWLEFPTECGRVLLMDNELHAETLANRIPRVAGAMQLPPANWGEDFYVEPLRGRLQDLFRMEEYFKKLPPGQFKLIILDAFYRFMPRDMDENDNGTMANLYNVLDRVAGHLKAAFVLIHHTTKGLQSDKGVTDVGAGAGSQSRAADCHLVLRPHEQEGCLSVDAVARSWPSPASFVLRQAFPLWVPDHTLDPSDLKKPKRKQSRSSREDAPDEPLPDWTPDSFVEAFLDAEGKSRPAILMAANEQGLSDYRAGKFLERAEALGLVQRWSLGHNRVGYATEPQPALPLDAKTDEEPSKRDQVVAAIRKDPGLSSREIAGICDVSVRYVQRIRSDEGAN